MLRLEGIPAMYRWTNGISGLLSKFYVDAYLLDV